MPHPIEDQLVTKLFQRTTQGQVDWQTTGLGNQLTASFAGKYAILLSGGPLGGHSLQVRNADGDELVNLSLLEEPRLQALYDLAFSHARKETEAQLADLLLELDKPQREPR